MAGAALIAFESIGLCHVPVGTGNTERLMLPVEHLRPDAVVLTPSYAGYLLEWGAERGVTCAGSSVERVLVAGEPGGGEPAFRAKLEEGWGARVTEVMGIGDIGVSLWGECEEQDGMHFAARGFVHAGADRPRDRRRDRDGGRRQRRARADPPQASGGAAPALPHPRPRRGPHGHLRLRPHRPAPALHRADRRHAHRPRRERLPLGRARGGGLVRPRRQRPHPRPAAAAGVEQEPPLPVSVELAPGATGDAALADAIRDRLRSVLVVQTRVELVPWGSLQRSEHKARLVEH